METNNVTGAYKIFWLHRPEVNYVGTISWNRFVGNTLEIILKKMVSVVKDANSDPWRASGAQFVNYRFEFRGCKIVSHNDPKSIKIHTSEGDTIILANGEEDKRFVERHYLDQV